MHRHGIPVRYLGILRQLILGSSVSANHGHQHQQRHRHEQKNDDKAKMKGKNRQSKRHRKKQLNVVDDRRFKALVRNVPLRTLP